ncbi:MAG: 2OG-Fe(II) oxygenase family protein [Kofleriaceae bacterium]
MEAAPASRERRVLTKQQWDLVCEFTQPRTAPDVYRSALIDDADFPLESLAELLDVWVDAGILEVSEAEAPAPEPDRCLRDYLRQDIFGNSELVSQVATQLQAGRLVVIPDAIQPELAHEVWRALDAHQDWYPFETTSSSPGFHFSHHNIDEPLPDTVRDAMALFKSESTRRFAQSISGRPCSGGTSITASWYQPGDFSLPHTDSAATRTVAFVWHLARDWDDVWGGQLVWCPTGAFVFPRFNSLSMFNVTGTSLHFVAAVSRRAMGKRLGLNGWWHQPPDETTEPRPRDETRQHVVTSYGAPLSYIGGHNGVVIV